MKTISNGIITLQIEEHGAELSSIKCNGREYLWGAYPEFWKRHSPVLFPIVGSVWNSEFRSGNKTYKMGQHGIARDMDFMPLSLSATEAWFMLESTDETLAKYPYPFILRIGYELHERSIDVCWEVENPSDKDIAFQIGAHPAFYWPLISDETINQGVEAMNAELAKSTNRGYFKLGTEANELKCTVITQGGCVSPKVDKTVALHDGYLSLDTTTFNEDALIMEHNQLNRVTLCDNDKKPYLTVEFDSPLLGLWSPPSKNAPFVCIEPWYGRTDKVNYDGTFEAKDWMNTLKPGETFTAKYTITIE